MSFSSHFTLKFGVKLRANTAGAFSATIPDFAALRRLKPWGCMLTARASQGGDFVSRFFAPKKGVPEDPVTGSAHCRLGPYWAAKLGKTKFKAEQVSARGGRMDVEVLGERVRLSGRAVGVAKGELLEG